MAMKSEILGAAELQRVMRKLPGDLQERVLGSMSRAGAVELQRHAFARLALAMRSRTPREDDVVIRRRRNRSGKPQAIYDVGPPKRKPQLRWLHSGTEPHIISAVEKFGTRRGVRNVRYGTRDSKVLTNRSKFFGRQVNHPGQQAQPWLETAVHSSRDAVMAAMAAAARRALPRVTRVLVSKEYRNKQLTRFFR